MIIAEGSGHHRQAPVSDPDRFLATPARVVSARLRPPSTHPEGGRSTFNRRSVNQPANRPPAANVIR